MLDRVHRLGVPIGPDRYGVDQPAGRDILHPLGDGGREQCYLWLLQNAVQQLVDVRAKPFVEHLIGLVNDEKSELVEAQIASVEQIEQPARRTDDYLRAGGEEGYLIGDIPAAIEKGAAQPVTLREALDHRTNLEGAAYASEPPPLPAPWLRPGCTVPPGEWQMPRLTRPGLGLTDHVFTHQ